MAEPERSRREFVKALGASAVVPWFSPTHLPNVLPAAPRPSADTAAARFYRSLGRDQRQRIAFPFDHPLRQQVSHNWAIAAPAIRDLTAVQQALCLEVFSDLCSADGHARFWRQMREDSGGFEQYHVAVFGEPGVEGQFEWVLTGRHATLRADGNSPAGASFRGPIFYGHAAPIGNVWNHQAEQAAAIFDSLDRAQKSRALVSRAAASAALADRAPGAQVVEAGLPVAALDGERKAMVQSLLRSVLEPFRIVEADGSPSCLRDLRNADALRLTYYGDGADPADRVNVCKLEGPSFAWYFHGTPHVHAWLSMT